jgi:tetratricopeptide (TPR) repeat protein
MSSGTGELRPAVVLVALLLLVALVLLPQLGFGLVYDDGWTLVTNGFLRSPEDLGLLLTPEAVARNVPDAFRPGLVLFDALSYRLLGLDARWHHALSIALHLGVCAAAAAWLRRLGAPLALWAGTVAVFGLLAIHAEAIAVVSFREDLLAALLALLACDAASAAVRRPRPAGLAALAGLALLAACACKQSAAAAPLLWLLAEGLAPWQPRRPWRRLALGAGALLLGAAAMAAHTTWLFGHPSPYAPDDPRLYATRVGLSPVLAMSTQIHLGYLQQMLVPFGLSPEYVDAGAAWTDPATLLAAAALLGLLAAAAAAARRRPLLALAVLGAFALALPTSNLAAMPNMRADRFMYLPSLPVCLGLAALLLAAGRRLRRPALTFAPLAAFAVVQGAVLAGASFTYRSNTQLWTVARQKAPGSARAQAVAGELLLGALAGAPSRERRELLLARAEAHCISAERLDPVYELPQLCFARLASARQDWPEAHRRFAAALAVSRDRNARILAGLAQVSLDLPDLEEDDRRRRSLQALERGLSEYPYSPELHDVAGQIFHRLGDPVAASRHYQRALKLAPERGEPLLGLTALCLDLGLPVLARHLVAAHTPSWLAADPVDRTALIARHRDALRLYAPTMVESGDLVGVFANEP